MEYKNKTETENKGQKKIRKYEGFQPPPSLTEMIPLKQPIYTVPSGASVIGA